MSYIKSQMRGNRARKERRSRTVSGWVVCPGDILAQFIVFITAAGNAVLLAGSDGDNMLSLTVYSDGDKDKYYIRPGDDIPAVLQEVIEDYCAPPTVDAFTAFLSARLTLTPQPGGKATTQA